MGIVVFGAVFVDIKGYPVDKYIAGGRNVGYVVQTHGGVSRNVAEDIANVELRPTFVSVVDHSGTSTDVLKRLERHKINTKYIVRKDGGLGTWLAVFDNSGDVTASISQRPDLSPIRLVLEEHGDEIFSTADSIAVEIDIDQKILKRIFALAAKYGKKVYAVVSNMSLAMERRDLLRECDCIICNEQEAGMLFSVEYENRTPQDFLDLLRRSIFTAGFRRMVVTLGSQGAVYASQDGESGYTPPQKVDVIDTTGAGDAFFAGCAIGLTYGKTLAQSCEIGTRLAASVICTKESVCPRFNPREFDLQIAPEE
ncbi:MAG: carbohydrate kinase family protein [Solobacterium sp.]|nr:carbohydrate kinase family protein [Solobacterium sp.]